MMMGNVHVQDKQRKSSLLWIHTLGCVASPMSNNFMKGLREGYQKKKEGKIGHKR